MLAFHFHMSVICKVEGFDFDGVKFIHFNFIVSAFYVLRNLYLPQGHKDVLFSIDLCLSLSQCQTVLIL